jgi:hypothetical protein
MTRVDAILREIETLSWEERAELARRLYGWTDDEWDERMKRDAAAGKFDPLIEQVDRDIASGRLRELP